MKRTAFLAGSSVAFALMTSVSAQAATCITTGAVIQCGALGSDPVASSDDGVTVIVDSGATLVSDDENTAPVDLSGDATAVENNGVIEQTDTGGYAILGAGDAMTVTNTGTIIGADRGIAMDGGSNLNVINGAGGIIAAERQAVRAGTDSPGARVENHGVISSQDGRALQLRSYGATVINHGLLIGGEEVVEARGGFTLENYGTIMLNDPTIEDEDGVQFASGTVQNFGSITGSDDGIDVDEGTITNHAGGVIRSTAPDTNSNSGIDVDEVYDDGINPERAPGPLTIVNMGLIEGPSAIGTDPASASEIHVTNSGTLNGRGGTAIRLADGQGDSSLTVFGDSQVFGDVLFGAGDDLVTIGALTSGLLSSGIFDGDLGSNTVLFETLGLGDFLSFDIVGETVDVAFLAGRDVIEGQFLNFSNWVVGGTTYSANALQSAIIPQPSTVPLPAGLPMMLAGLGLFGLIRRRG